MYLNNGLSVCRLFIETRMAWMYIQVNKRDRVEERKLDDQASDPGKCFSGREAGGWIVGFVGEACASCELVLEGVVGEASEL